MSQLEIAATTSKLQGGLELFEIIHANFPDRKDVRMVIYLASGIVVINDTAPADGPVRLRLA